MAIRLSIAITLVMRRRADGMNSDANPIWTLGLDVRLDVAVCGRWRQCRRFPEMHRVAVDVQHWMTDKQFADVFAISTAFAGAERADRDLIGYSVAERCRRAWRRPLAMCGPTADPCLLCEPSVCSGRAIRAGPRSFRRRWFRFQSGLMGASGLILAQTSDRTWVGRPGHRRRSGAWPLPRGSIRSGC